MLLASVCTLVHVTLAIPPKQHIKETQPTSARSDSSVRRLAAGDGNNVMLAVKIAVRKRRSFDKSVSHGAHKECQSLTDLCKASQCTGCMTTPRNKSDPVDPPVDHYDYY